MCCDFCEGWGECSDVMGELTVSLDCVKNALVELLATNHTCPKCNGRLFIHHMNNDGVCLMCWECYYKCIKLFE